MNHKAHITTSGNFEKKNLLEITVFFKSISSSISLLRLKMVLILTGLITVVTGI